MKVSWDASGYLLQVAIDFTQKDLVLFDTLLISTTPNNFTSWNHVVHTGGINNQSHINGTVIGDGLYSVKSPFQSSYYTTVKSGGRDGSPEGIKAEDLTSISSMTHGSQTLTAPGIYTIIYDFSMLSIKILVDKGASLVYAPWCANDVIAGSFTPQQQGPGQVPEPATMLLFGTGLAGLGFAGARHRTKA